MRLAQRLWIYVRFSTTNQLWSWSPSCDTSSKIINIPQLNSSATHNAHLSSHHPRRSPPIKRKVVYSSPPRQRPGAPRYRSFFSVPVPTPPPVFAVPAPAVSAAGRPTARVPDMEMMPGRPSPRRSLLLRPTPGPAVEVEVEFELEVAAVVA
jgi:hypothetical protein